MPAALCTIAVSGDTLGRIHRLRHATETVDECLRRIIAAVPSSRVQLTEAECAAALRKLGGRATIAEIAKRSGYSRQAVERVVRRIARADGKREKAVLWRLVEHGGAR
ncbi:MAG: hypothetical protein RJA59_1651 [Pseudomonadota bacterium]|jgi:AraC-like DNA-binding protein